MATRITRLGALAAAAAACLIGFDARAECYPDLPRPEIRVMETRDGIDGLGNAGTWYDLSVTNRAAFPDALFAPAPQLPSCGTNASASRTWVHVWVLPDVSSQWIYNHGFCALGSAQELGHFWFWVPQGSTPPQYVHVELQDRECDITYPSRVIFTAVNPGCDDNLAAIAGGPYSGLADIPVFFDASASVHSVEIASYEWDWNLDGTYDVVSAWPVVEHTWPGPAAFSGRVGLRITNSCWQASENTAYVSIEGGGNACGGSFEASAGGPYSGYVGEPVTFSAAGTVSGWPVAYYEWDWTDDGNYDAFALPGDPAPTHVYAEAFDGNVRVRVTNSCGQKAVALAPVRISTGLAVRCWHEPLWPQPGETVTITVEALDTAAVPVSGPVDTVEIWVDDTTVAAATRQAGTGPFSHAFLPVTGAETATYRCRVGDGGFAASTGWRIFGIGAPASGRAVPVMYTGPSNTRLDVVFIADRSDFPGPDDPGFLADTLDLIRTSLFSEDLWYAPASWPYLFHQDELNLWIALDTGLAGDATTLTLHEPPEGWVTEYGFADAGAIVHAAPIWDFAVPSWRLFSTPTNATVQAGISGWGPFTLLHESGHATFGLADEYCGQTAYFQQKVFPNIYSTQAQCLADPLAVGVTGACQQITNTNCTKDWYRVEPGPSTSDDLMTNAGHMTVNRADQRRIDFVFDLCRSASF